MCKTVAGIPGARYAPIAAMALALLALLASPAMANFLTGASATADCSGYALTVTASQLEPGFTYHVDYTFTLTCGSSTTTPTGTIEVIGDANGNGTGTGTGTWPGAPLSSTCTVTGTATLRENPSSSMAITINGSTSATLSCGTTGGGKSFHIGPASMEGDLRISPGDWISGGYNFKFVSKTHAATQYTVTATVTVPVICPNGKPGGNIVIPLGAPGQLNGGGVTTYTYSIPAKDTTNHATNDQNSILAWEGAVQAPDLCGGGVMRNQTGAIFNVTVTQNPQVGLVDWQFHYRDPNAKGKGNVNCTDASNPKRNDAATCGASWSNTVRDP